MQMFVSQVLTGDLGGNSKCSEFTAEICRRIQDLDWRSRSLCGVSAPLNGAVSMKSGSMYIFWGGDETFTAQTQMSHDQELSASLLTCLGLFLTVVDRNLFIVSCWSPAALQIHKQYTLNICVYVCTYVHRNECVFRGGFCSLIKQLIGDITL